MFLIKSAWDNIVFHAKRSILSVLLIAVASAALLLYRGFVAYSEQGLALNFIAESGHIQVRIKDADENGHTALLSKKDLQDVQALYKTIHAIKNYDSVLQFQGIIGTEDQSSVFWASGYDNPQSLGATEGIPVFADSQDIVLGKTLFEKLKLNIQETPFVNIMASIGHSGMVTGSLPVSGYLDTGIPENDAGLVIACRRAIIDFFELEDCASYNRLFLQKEADLPQVQAILNAYFKEHALHFETKNWKELHPSWAQISGLFNTQFSVISAILCILIFIALTQSLQSSFMERIAEFGTMEAIGLKRSSIIFMLMFEVCMLSVAGIIAGILLAGLGNTVTDTFNIMMVPPGYSKGYRLHFFITLHAVYRTQSFIFLTVISAVLYPIYTINKHSTVQLIHYN